MPVKNQEDIKCDIFSNKECPTYNCGQEPSILF